MPSSRRTAIHVDGLSHGSNPIPAASRIGNLVYSGGVSGLDPQGGRMPEEFEDEVAQMFSNMRATVEAAGGSVGDIIRVTVFARDRDGSAALNEAWVEMFPDGHDRPARHLNIADLHPAMRIQCEFVAVLDA